MLSFSVNVLNKLKKCLLHSLAINCAYFNSYQEKITTVYVNRADVNAPYEIIFKQKPPPCIEYQQLNRIARNWYPCMFGLPVVSVNDSMVRSFPSLGIFQFGVCFVLQEKSHNSNVTLTGCSHQ